MSVTEGIPSFEEVKRPIADTITTTEFYCARVEKCHIRDVLKALGTRIPMTNEVVVHLSGYEQFKHLKRVNRCEYDENLLFVLLWEKKDAEPSPSFSDIPYVSDDAISVVKVPLYPAETKELFLQGRALWPITFHPMTPPPELTSEEKERFVTAMKRAIALGREAATHGNAPIGMVILNEQGDVIGECGDNRQGMFLDHCCFACVRNQSELLRQKYAGKHANKTDPYLCTNCDVILTREPCVMLAF